MSKFWVAGLAVLLSAGAAKADEFVRPDCRSLVSASDRLSYERAEHPVWYRRFWTGECGGLPLYRCKPGSPNWNDVASQMMSRAAPAARNAVRLKACRLGQTIGHEWSRDKPIRRIDTADLKAMLKLLNETPDVSAGLDRVDARVRELMGRPRR
ncbi:hypothetical protein [Caulobacter sp. NIBR2454]|uniref:hypothetical protein n=1 Tax=Caulobacter sp. NIBR2454 TaxID=3015996 RepID=UPI0022B6FAF4|nr:hypothetical protein [Caulobacter sp. NIBR2454]